MTVPTIAIFQTQSYLGKTVPNRIKDKTRFESSRPRDTTLAIVLTGRVFFTPRTPSNVSKYLSPSNGNIGNMLINATLRRISCSQKNARANWYSDWLGRKSYLSGTKILTVNSEDRAA